MADVIRKMRAGHKTSDIDDTIDEIASAKGTYTTLSERLSGIESEQESQGAALDEDRAALMEIVDSGAKNIIDINPPNGTDSTGITYTPNADKSFTAQGTATSLSQKRLLTVSAEDAPKFNGMVLSGCPSGGANNTYRLVFMRDGSPYTTYATDYGDGTVIQNVPAVPCRVFLYIESGQTVDIMFKPMICTKAAWDISHQYVPHRPNYDELIARIEALEGGV